MFLVGDKSAKMLSQLTAIFVDITVSSLVSSCDRSVCFIADCKKLFYPMKLLEDISLAL